MCSLFGMLDFNNYFSSKRRERMMSVLSRECEARGTDATGIAYNTGGRLAIYKRPLQASRLRFHLPKDANCILGHTRLTTQGNEQFNPNNHPFPGKADGLRFALAHNGVLHNDRILRQTEKLPASPIETDSYIAVQLLEKYGELSIGNLGEMAEQLEGSFTFTLLDENNNFYIVKGDSPLALYSFGGCYLYASTESLLDSALKKLGMNKFRHEKVALACGDILSIDRNGHMERGRFDIGKLWESQRSWYLPRARTLYPLSGKMRTSLDDLYESAGNVGMSPEEVDVLLDYGYNEWEIEVLLSNPVSMNRFLDELLCDDFFVPC